MSQLRKTIKSWAKEKDFEVHTYGFIATEGGSLGSFMKGITSPPLSKNWHPIASIAASDDSSFTS